MQALTNLFEERSSLFSRNGVGTVAVLAFGLGLVFGGSALVAVGLPTIRDFALYLMLLATFHYSEYITTALYNPSLLTADSFLINHSREYTIAFLAAVCEYWLEWLFFGFKAYSFFIVVGAAISVVGLLFRILALNTAKAAFTHQIQEKRREQHQLVTSGVYRYVRHPGYFGWYWWTVGSQILLCNPFCTAAFAYVAYRFFADRIPIEERKLCSAEFFGEEYVKYRAITPTLIPGIK